MAATVDCKLDLSLIKCGFSCGMPRLAPQELRHMCHKVVHPENGCRFEERAQLPLLAPSGSSAARPLHCYWTPCMTDFAEERPTTIQAITLWQPWASLIFALVMKHETRSWPYPPRLHGRRIAIHAAKVFPRPHEVPPDLQDLCVRTFGRSYRQTLPRGVVMGTVRLVACVPTESGPSDDTDDGIAGDWSPGRWAWLLADVQALACPQVARGRQRWWQWLPTDHADLSLERR